MKSYYHPPSALNWQGRHDDVRFHQVVQLVDWKFSPTPATAKNAIALVGFCSDTGVVRNLGRPGAFEGPKAFRQALARLPLNGDATPPIIDVGDIVCTGDDLESSQKALKEITADLLKNGYLTVVIGGGHELTWGHYQGFDQAFPDSALNIVNFDAHFDLRPLIEKQYSSSGTSFLQIAHRCSDKKKPFSYTCLGVQGSGNTRSLFAKAEDLGVTFASADEYHLGGQAADQLVNKIVTDDKGIYLSLCLDVFAACYAPGVSAPQPLGLLPWQVIPQLRKLAASGKVRTFDIAELNPSLDQDGRTASLSAQLFVQFYTFLPHN